MNKFFVALSCAIVLVTFSVEPSVAQDLVNVSFSKTTESDPFDPNAVWLGSGTTDAGDEVDIRTSGLVVSPGDGLFNVDAFTFEILGLVPDVSLSMIGTFTPTGDLTGVTGDIFLMGTQNSTLVASTENGLVTIMGDISFIPVPEPSALILGGFAVLSGLMFRWRPVRSGKVRASRG